MSILKSIAIAFSLYSKIPMPQFPWEKKEMETMLLFFPWIGGVVGLCVYGWYVFSIKFSVGSLCYTLIGCAIPLLLTGGFHVDGFLDTMDALHSYQDRERKLEILKDSHIGAFAVIMAALYGMLYIGSFSEIQRAGYVEVICGMFFFSRALSGLGVVSFPKAKKDGMVSLFASKANRKKVQMGLAFEAMLCACWMIWRHFYIGILAVFIGLMVYTYYYWKTKKEFGGITGDTAGYFVLICEGAIVFFVAMAEILERGM